MEETEIQFRPCLTCQRTRLVQSCYECRRITCIHSMCMHHHHHHHHPIPNRQPRGSDDTRLVAPMCQAPYISWLYTEISDMVLFEYDGIKVYGWWCRSAHPETGVLNTNVLRQCWSRSMPYCSVYSGTSLLSYLQRVFQKTARRVDQSENLRDYLYELSRHFPRSELWPRFGHKPLFGTQEGGEEKEEECSESKYGTSSEYVVQTKLRVECIDNKAAAAAAAENLLRDFICYEWFHGSYAPTTDDVSLDFYETLRNVLPHQRQESIRIVLGTVHMLNALVPLVLSYDRVSQVPCNSVVCPPLMYYSPRKSYRQQMIDHLYKSLHVPKIVVVHGSYR